MADDNRIEIPVSSNIDPLFKDLQRLLAQLVSIKGASAETSKEMQANILKTSSTTSVLTTAIQDVVLEVVQLSDKTEQLPQGAFDEMANSAEGLKIILDTVSEELISFSTEVANNALQFTNGSSQKQQALLQEVSKLKELQTALKNASNPEDQKRITNELFKQTQQVSQLTNELKALPDDKLAKPVQNFRTQILNAKKEAFQLQQQFEQGLIPESVVTAAIAKVARLQEQFNDFNDSVKAFNPEAKFTAVTQVVSGLAGGFTAVQGALAIVGVEGEAVQETLLKVQGALALSQGLNQVLTLGDAWKNLKDVLGLAKPALTAAAMAAQQGAELTADAASATADLSKETIKEGANVSLLTRLKRALNLEKKVAVVTTTAETVATDAQTVAVTAEATATEGAVVATKSWTAALLANPMAAMAIAILAATAAIAIYIATSDDAAQAQQRLNDEQEDHLKRLQEFAAAEDERDQRLIEHAKNEADLAKAANKPIEDRLLAEQNLASARVRAAAGQAAFYGDEIDNIGLVDAKLESLRASYASLVDIETDKDVLEQKKREIDLLEQQNETAKKVRKTLEDAKQALAINNIEADKTRYQNQLTQARSFVAANLAEVEKGTNKELQLKLQAIKIDKDAKIEELKGDASRAGERAKIEADAEKAIREAKNAFLLAALADRKANDQAALNLVKKGSEEEFALRKKIIQDQLALDEAAIGISAERRKELVSKADKDIADLKREHLLKQADEEASILKATQQIRLAIAEAGSVEELNAKKALLVLQADIDVQAIKNSEKSEKEKAILIQAIHVKANKEIADIDKAAIKQQLDFELEFTKKSIDIENDRLKFVADNENLGVVTRAKAREKILENNLKAIKLEQAANVDKYNNDLQTQEEFIKQKQKLDQDAANATQALYVEHTSNLKNLFVKLGIDISEAQVQFAQMIVGNVSSIFNQLQASRLQELDAAKSANDEILSGIQSRLDAATDELDKQIALNNEGYSSNIKGKRAEIAAINAEKVRALEEDKRIQKEREKVQRAQIISETATQASGLITSSVNIFKTTTEAFPGPIGVGVAIAVIAAMLAAFGVAKARSIAATSLEKGGKIKGQRHSGGGEKYYSENPNAPVYELEDGEFVSHRTATAENQDFLEGMNKGDYSQVTPARKISMIKQLLLGTGVELSTTEAGRMVREREVLRTTEIHSAMMISKPGDDPQIDMLIKELRYFRNLYEDKMEVINLPNGDRLERHGNQTKLIHQQ